MEYYFTNHENISGSSLIITGDDFKHLQKVLRKKTGDIIYVTDGNKNLYKTRIEEINIDNIKCLILEKQFDINEPKTKVTLYPALIKSPSRFDFIIEKSVELGVNEISPVVTENVVNKTHDKTERWQTIALSAMKQSQRCYLPRVNPPQSFEKAIDSQSKDDLKIIADERIFTNNIFGSELKNLVHKNRNVALFTGPEGGFTEDEIDSAVKKGFVILNLGERKLRSETAAIAALSMILVK
jgi:16S rRNA (uracil1498-N3)-methyltransferase